MWLGGCGGSFNSGETVMWLTKTQVLVMEVAVMVMWLIGVGKGGYCGG